jgi:hypothetical protein
MTDGTDVKRIRRISFRVGVVGVAWLLLPLRIKQPVLYQIVDILLTWAVLVACGVAIACLPVRKWLRAVGSIPFFLGAAVFPVLILWLNVKALAEQVNWRLCENNGQKIRIYRYFYRTRR